MLWLCVRARLLVRQCSTVRRACTTATLFSQMVLQVRALALALNSGKAATKLKLPDARSNRDTQEAYVDQFSWAEVQAALAALCNGDFLPESYASWCKDTFKQQQHMEKLQKAGQAIRGAWHTVLPPIL